MEPHELVPAYANGALVNHSDYEFTITFLRKEHILPPDAQGRLPVAIATRVVLSPGAMKEFLDAAIENYESLRERMPSLQELKALEDDAE